MVHLRGPEVQWARELLFGPEPQPVVEMQVLWTTMQQQVDEGQPWA